MLQSLILVYIHEGAPLSIYGFKSINIPGYVLDVTCLKDNGVVKIHSLHGLPISLLSFVAVGSGPSYE